MSILNFFNNNNILEEKFKFSTKEPIIIGDFEKQERKEGKENLTRDEVVECIKKFRLHNEKYYNFTGNNILIKAFSYEKNLDIYEFLKSKNAEIEKAIEVLKVLNENVKIKIASKTAINEIDYKAPSKELIEFDEKEFAMEYFDNEKLSDILIVDLLDVVYLGEVFLNGVSRDFIYATAFGEAIEKGKIIKVRIGTEIKEIFNVLHGDEKVLSKIIEGGFISGVQKSSLNEKINGDEKAFLFLTEKEESRKKQKPCIRCSGCLRICPKGLNPIKLAELWKIGEKDEFLKFGGAKCISCGLCSYSCPSNIELSHKIHTAKENYIEKDNKEIRSEQLV